MTGRFLQKDPLFTRMKYRFGSTTIDLLEQSLNLYPAHFVPHRVDPTGLSWLEIVAKILGKKWSACTIKRAGKRLAYDLLEKIGTKHPSEAEAKKIIDELVKEGWSKGPLDSRSQKLAGKSLEEGGGILLKGPDGGELMWHPAGPTHGVDAGPYWKFSSTESHTLRNIGGKISIFILGALFPLAADAAENGEDCGCIGKWAVMDAAQLALPIPVDVDKTGGFSIVTTIMSWLGFKTEATESSSGGVLGSWGYGSDP